MFLALNSFFQDLDLYGVIDEIEKRGLTFDELLAIPEKDEWVYSDGKSTTCVAFILAMYKEAGLFGPISKSIQVTEFTVITQLSPYTCQIHTYRIFSPLNIN